MNKFLKLKEYFNNGFWNIKRLENAVKKGWISEEEFFKITGVKYGI